MQKDTDTGVDTNADKYGWRCNSRCRQTQMQVGPDTGADRQMQTDTDTGTDTNTVRYIWMEMQEQIQADTDAGADSNADRYRWRRKCINIDLGADTDANTDANTDEDADTKLVYF